MRSRRPASLAMLVVVLVLSITTSPANAAATCRASTPSSDRYTINLCISAPENNAIVSGNAVIVVTPSATGSAPGVSQVIAYLNGAYLLMDYRPNLIFELPTAHFVDGRYTLGIRAIMGDGFITDITTIELTFSNGVTTPPVNSNVFMPHIPSVAAGQRLIVGATADAASGELPDVPAMLASWDLDMFLYLGDVYDKGTYTEFHNWYGTRHSNFGQFYEITNPTVGNHEYESDGIAAAYFYYWDNIPNYYSYDVAGWHFVALNSNTEFNQLRPGTPQYNWLVQDLGNTISECIIVYMHHPAARMGSSGVQTTVGKDLWPVFVNNGVDILLTAHHHQYQRWHPMNVNGKVAASGPVQFVIGTGGHEISEFSKNDSRVAVGYDTAPQAYGALRLEFDSSGVNYRYINIFNDTLDAGNIACNGTTPPPTNTPVHTPTLTPSKTATAIQTPENTLTPTATATGTQAIVPTHTPDNTFTPSDTATGPQTITPTHTPTLTATEIPSGTPIVTPEIPQPPSAPILIAPQPGEQLVDPSPEFVWMQNPIWENVILYKLVVKNAAGQRIHVEKMTNPSCEGGMCRYDLNTAGKVLLNGAYTWSVKAKNSSGKMKSMRQLTIEFPGIAILSDPASRMTTFDSSPVFTWTQVTLADEYKLRIEQKGVKVFKKWFNMAEANCNGVMCSVDLSTLGVQLPIGKLRWRIETRNRAFSPSKSISASSQFKILPPTE